MHAEKKSLLEQKLSGLINSHKSIVEKFVYYVLAINAACIGFAINQTQTLSIGYDKIPLLIALLSWLISFFLGLLNIKYTQLATTVNIMFLKSQILEENEQVSQHYQKLLNLQKRLYKIDFFQNILLGIGILAYIVWHIIHMINNNIPTTPIQLDF